MPIELKMPALSPTMEEGTLAKWLVKEGDTVAAGDILAEIETDKATMEFEAVDEGTVTKILVPEGTRRGEGRHGHRSARRRGRGAAAPRRRAAERNRAEATRRSRPRPEPERGARPASRSSPTCPRAPRW